MFLSKINREGGSLEFYLAKMMEIEKIKLNTETIGKKIIYFEEIDSTQEYVKQNQEELPSGTVVFAEKQTRGKGTKGNKWHTDNNGNIAMTILLKPNCDLQKLEGFTLKMAEIIQEVIEDLYGYSLQIKEPNDLLMNGKKISGILTQSTSRQNKVLSLMIGIGFNVNEMNFPEEILEIATSLKKEIGKDFSVEEIVIQILERLEKYTKILS